MYRLADWSRDEGGSITVLHLLALLFLAVLAAAVVNIHQATRTRIEAQNGADAAAQAAGLTRARALNAITAANHLYGQLAAIVALHEAIGGRNPGRENICTAELMALDAELLSVSVGNPEFSYPTNRVAGPAKSGATIYDARLALKGWAIVAHELESAAKAAAESVLFSWAAPGLFYAAIALMVKVVEESFVIDGVEYGALGATPMIEGYRALMPLVALYADRIVLQAPVSLREAARQAAEANGCRGEPLDLLPLLPATRERIGRGKGGAWPSRPGLALQNPTRKDLPDADLHPLATSQWTRAAHPWAAHWGRPMRLTLDLGATLSLAGHSYRQWTDALLLAHCDKDQRGGRGLYILRDSTPDSKGREIWTTARGSRRAEALFSNVATARRTLPVRAAPRLFRSLPTEAVGVARAMTYQPNPKRGGGSDRQPIPGWDTLAWEADVNEFGSLDDCGCPRIRLGWDSALIPVGRLTRGLFRGTFPLSSELWTH